MKSNVDSILKWPVPTTKAGARSLQAKFAYYRAHIPNYSSIARPLLEVQFMPQGDNVEFTPSKALHTSVQKLKKILTTYPVLAFPRFEESASRFVLDTDFCSSTSSMAAVLSQEQDGKERVICYGAKRLSKAQNNYSAAKGELATLLYFLNKYSYYLKSRPFIVRTDHSALLNLKTYKHAGVYEERLLTALATFNFEVIHRAGRLHVNADALSRAPHHSPLREEETVEFDTIGVAAINTRPPPINL